MTAAEALKPALVAALRGIEGANGVWDGVPVRATMPYLMLGDLAAVDWGTKDAAGRELRVAVTVRDAGDDAARVAALAGAVEAAVSGLPRDLAGWRVASVVLVRSRVVSEGAGRWAAMVDHRVRMLAG